MDNHKQKRSLREILGSWDAGRVLLTLPSIIRGSARGRRWEDVVLEEFNEGQTNVSEPSQSGNPLRDYYDSVQSGKGVWKWLHYFDIYHRHLQKFIGKEVHVVEVGIFSGGSLDMWKKYFGSNCTIYGVDIQESCKIYESERTRVFIGDQSDRSFWARFRESVPQVDVLIDDAGHIPEHQIITLEEMLPHMRPGSVYLCEDIHGRHNRFPAYVYGMTKDLNAFTVASQSQNAVTPSAFQRSVASVHLYPFITVVEKTPHVVNQLIAPKHGTEWQSYAPGYGGS